MSALLVPIMSRFALAWPAHAEQPCPCTRKGKTCTGPDTAEPFPFERAFSERFDDDPHFTAYAPVDDHRLDHGAIGRVAITMQLFVVDVEPVGHAPRTPEWDVDQQPRIDRVIALGAFYYSTRGGYRLVWRLAETFTIASKQDAEDWSASYLAALDEIERELGIVGDRTCKDWTRLYRLPFVTRDGVPQEPTVAGVLGQYALDRVPASPVNTTIAPMPSDTSASPALIEHARDLLRRHGPAIEGASGDEHTYRACAIVVRDCGLDDATAWSVITEWNATCRPPWDADELRAKMDNAYNYGQGEIGSERSNVAILGGITKALERSREPSPPPTATIDEFTANTSAGPTPLDEFAGEPEPEPEYEPGTYGAERERALEEVRDHMTTLGVSREHATQTSAPLFEDARELFATEDNPISWRVERLFTDGGIAMISGEPKSAKTWLAIECAIGVATGTYVLEPKYKATQGNVAYFFTEDKRNAIKTRTQALLASRDLTPEAVFGKLLLQPRGKHLDVMNDEHCAAIIASVRMHERVHGKIVLLNIDPLRNIHTLEEDKSGEMMRVFERLKMLGTILDCIVLLVHHAKKATAGGSKRGGQKMRGSSAMHGFLDAGMYLDDVRVNAEGNVFTNAFESEVKDAKSAGKFELVLDIADDAFTHTARKATWVVLRGEDTAAAVAETEGTSELSAEILRVLYHAEHTNSKIACTALTIRPKVGRGLRLVQGELAKLERERLIQKRTVGKKHCGWRLTGKGREEAHAIVNGGAS